MGVNADVVTYSVYTLGSVMIGQDKPTPDQSQCVINKPGSIALLQCGCLQMQRVASLRGQNSPFVVLFNSIEVCLCRGAAMGGNADVVTLSILWALVFTCMGKH